MIIMGDPKKKRRQFQRPRKSFQKERIEKENELKKTYGLKNKKELYRFETMIRKKRGTARKLLAFTLENRLKREKELLDSLKKIGVLSGNPTLDDVLVLTPEALLERRLQTVVWRKGMANTIKQSRQFIVHGHIAINGKKVSKPGYIVKAGEDDAIGWSKKEIIFEQKEAHTKKTLKQDGKLDELRKTFEEAKPISGEEGDGDDKIFSGKDQEGKND